MEPSSDADFMLALSHRLHEPELIAAEGVRARARTAETIKGVADERRHEALREKLQVRIDAVPRAVVRVLTGCDAAAEQRICECGQRAEHVHVSIAEAETVGTGFVTFDSERAGRTGAEVGCVDAQAIEKSRAVRTGSQQRERAEQEAALLVRLRPVHVLVAIDLHDSDAELDVVWSVLRASAEREGQERKSENE